MLGYHPTLIIRVDPQPSLASLALDAFLRDRGIQLEVACAKNPKKNPVAESTIRELDGECLTLQPERGSISELTLAISMSNMKSRIRWCALSAQEIWTQRDQVTSKQLPIEDRQLIIQQHLQCSKPWPLCSIKGHHQVPCTRPGHLSWGPGVHEW